MIDLPPPTYEQTIEAIVQCGVPRSNVSIKYEDYLQSDEVTITDMGEMSDEKMRCLKSAVHPFYVLTLENAAQRTTFYKFSLRVDWPERFAFPEGQVDSWKHASQKERRSTILAITTECKLPPSAIRLRRGGDVVIQPPPPDSSYEAVKCMIEKIRMQIGFSKIGFIGNEAFVEEDD